VEKYSLHDYITPEKIIQLPVTQHLLGKGHPSENLRRQQSLFPPAHSVNFNLFFFNRWLSYDCSTTVLHIWSHCHNIKLTNMASVYSVFPCHACECANLLSIDHLFLSCFLEQFSSAVLYFFMEDVLTSCPCHQWLYYIQCPSHFNTTNAIFLWSLEEWWWTFRMCEFHKAVAIVITFSITTLIHHMCRQHSSTGQCHCVQYE
jgi:hypothetical protein